MASFDEIWRDFANAEILKQLIQPSDLANCFEKPRKQVQTLLTATGNPKNNVSAPRELELIYPQFTKSRNV